MYTQIHINHTQVKFEYQGNWVNRLRSSDGQGNGYSIPGLNKKE